MFSNDLWPDIKLIKIDEGTYEYVLKKEGKLIRFDTQGNKYKKFILSKINNLK